MKVFFGRFPNKNSIENVYEKLANWFFALKSEEINMKKTFSAVWEAKNMWTIRVFFGEILLKVFSSILYLLTTCFVNTCVLNFLNRLGNGCESFGILIWFFGGFTALFLSFYCFIQKFLIFELIFCDWNSKRDSVEIFELLLRSFSKFLQ